MISVLDEYFRIRPADIALELRAPIDSEPGYFRFGDVPTCYGRLAGAQPRLTADSELVDVSPYVTQRNGHVELPFDPAEVVHALRHETYMTASAADGKKSLIKRAVRSAYYLVRPALPVAVRRHLQRRALSDWKTIPFPDWPLDSSVDDFLREVLAKVLVQREGRPLPFIWFWPEGKTACAILTHDVETDTGQKFCTDLMSMNESFGFRASFQFVPEQRYAKRDEVHDAVRERGHEINLHGLNHDGRLFDDREEFLRRAAKINEYARAWNAKGFRSPVLYRKQAWFGALDFDYDMSVPNTARLEAQRGGCCTVMPYFIGDLVELPTTTAEDYTLFHILRDYSTEVWLHQVARIEDLHGIFNLIAHPDYLTDRRPQGVYTKFLGELRDEVDRRGWWAPLPREAAAWWRARSRMTLVGDGSDLSIEGDPEGRARIAFARLQDNKVVFEIPSTQRVPKVR